MGTVVDKEIHFYRKYRIPNSYSRKLSQLKLESRDKNEEVLSMRWKG